MEPVAIIGICAVVLIVGYLLGLTVGKSAASKQTSEAEQARAELKQYREEVSEHFGKTAAHFQTLGQNYRELYDHMAAGADTLFEQGDAGNAVAFAPMAQLLAAEQAPTDVTPAAEDGDDRDEHPNHETSAGEGTDEPVAEAGHEAGNKTGPETGPETDQKTDQKTGDRITEEIAEEGRGETVAAEWPAAEPEIPDTRDLAANAAHDHAPRDGNAFAEERIDDIAASTDSLCDDALTDHDGLATDKRGKANA